MLLSFNEAVKEYGNQYQLSQALAQQKVYKIEEGIYSTDQYVSEVGSTNKLTIQPAHRVNNLPVICLAHSNAAVAGRNGFIVIHLKTAGL